MSSDVDFYSRRALTASEVALHLARMAAELEALSRALDSAERDAVNMREDDTLLYAKTYIGAAGAVELRKQTAVRDTHVTRLAAELAEVVVKGLRRQIRTLELRIEIGRSMGAAVRAEVSLSRSGYAT